MTELTTNCLIIGAGPAGFTAGIYASRAGLGPIMIEGMQPGGQLTTTTEIENYPGYPEGITGPKLMEDMRAQALRFGLEILGGEVTSIDLTKRPFVAQINGGTTRITARTVIVATGATARYLGIPGEDKFKGMGVSACATCDGFFFRNRTVAVVGGGDTACEEALYLAGLAAKVYLIVRRDRLRASNYMQRRVLDNPKIDVIFNANTQSLFGSDVLEGARLVVNKGTDNENTFDIAVDGFFLAIGHTPNTALFGGALELDPQGYIKLQGNSSATNVEGVFAAGDVADAVYQQAVSAAGMGCRAALDAERYLMMNQ